MKPRRSARPLPRIRTAAWWLAAPALGASSACADPLGIMVPAYFYPTAEAGNLWGKLNAAAAKVPVTAIMNPDSGPGAARDQSYGNAVTALTESGRGNPAAGGRVIGYIHSVYDFTREGLALRSLDWIKEEVDTYFTWYGAAGLGGIFVDEMRTDPDTVMTKVIRKNGTSQPTTLTVGQYYRELYVYITGKSPGWRVTGNPGTGGGGLETYLRPATRAADTLITFEDNNGYPATPPPSWSGGHLADHFSNIPYNIPSGDTMETYVRLAVSRNVGHIYVTNDVLDNPWDTLPSYWDREVELVRSLNAAAKPILLRLDKTPGQAASLTVTGAPGVYEVQVSPDLNAWSPAHTAAIATATGSFTWTDPAAPAPDHRFYRVAK